MQIRRKRGVEDEYRDDGVPESGHAPVSKWLIACYIALPLWGIAVFALYWNGASGWLDRGYWKQLERAANTTLPYRNYTQLN